MAESGGLKKGGQIGFREAAVKLRGYGPCIKFAAIALGEAMPQAIFSYS